MSENHQIIFVYLKIMCFGGTDEDGGEKMRENSYLRVNELFKTGYRTHIHRLEGGVWWCCKGK